MQGCWNNGAIERPGCVRSVGCRVLIRAAEELGRRIGRSGLAQAGDLSRMGKRVAEAEVRPKRAARYASAASMQEGQVHRLVRAQSRVSLSGAPGQAQFSSQTADQLQPCRRCERELAPGKMRGRGQGEARQAWL